MKVSKSVKQYARAKAGKPLTQLLGGPFSVLKYLPEAYGQDSYVIPLKAPSVSMSMDDGLPVPPPEFWLGYGNDFGDKGREWYLTKGKRDVDTMLTIVRDNAPLRPNARILEMGCAAGRMIRHLRPLAEEAEIWGVDIEARLVNWCKVNLAPPFHFATTTTIPHLPFADGYFDLIYTGSVFTHIDDLAEAWILELARILAPGGRAYLTIQDRHSVEVLEAGYYYDRSGYFTGPDRKEEYLTNLMTGSELFREHRDDFGMLVIGRDHASQVFYDQVYFARMVSPMFEAVSVTEEAYGHQTAVLLVLRS